MWTYAGPVVLRPGRFTLCDAGSVHVEEYGCFWYFGGLDYLDDVVSFRTWLGHVDHSYVWASFLSQLNYRINW